MSGHYTILVAWDKDGNVTFCKSFDFGPSNDNERELATAEFKKVVGVCHDFYYGSAEGILNKNIKPESNDND